MFVEHHSKAASVLGKFGKILGQTSGIIIKVPRFIGEVRILSGTLLFLRNLSGTTTCKNIFQQLFLLLLLVQALNAIFV